MTPFPKPPNGFVLHHSLTQDGQSVSWPAIRRHHTTVKGWLDIGYHVGVELAGAEYEALLGRPWDMEGAHCPQDAMNSHTLGVCLVGDFDKAPPPREQMVVLFDRVLIPFGRNLGIPLNTKTITFHRDHARDGRTCPGTQFTAALLEMYLAEFVPKGGEIV